MGIAGRAATGIGQSLYNTVVRPIKSSTLFTPEPQDAAEHVIQTVAGDPALNVYRAAKSVVDSGKNITKAAGAAYPKAIQDFHAAYHQFKNGDYRHAAVSGAETLNDASTILDPTRAGGTNNNREILEGMRPGADLVTPLARQGTDAATFLAAEKAPELTEYSPKRFKGGTVEGATRPANIAQGAINKSVGAAARDVRYGDPSRALVDEGITSPTVIGRQTATAQKIAEIKPQLDAALNNAAGRVSLHGTITPILDKFLAKLEDAALSPEEKQAANDEVAVAEDRISKYADHNGTISPREANEAKQEIGSRVGDWEKRPQPVSDLVQQTYHQLYGALKDEVNRLAGTAELNSRMSNLLSLRNALAEKANSVMRSPNHVGSSVLSTVVSGAGDVAPAIIKGAQTAADVAKATVPGSVVASNARGNTAQQEGTGN
jgi:hypothetical protein